jgi:hypothetical protein
MDTDGDVVTLWRPAGPGELALVVRRRSLAGFEPDVACGQAVVHGRCLR